MSAFNIRAVAISPDVLAVLLSSLLALIALYFGNTAMRLVDAIADEEVGIWEPDDPRRKLQNDGWKPEFILLILTAAITALGGGGRVGIPLCLAGLSIARLPKYVAMWPRATEIGAERQVLVAITGSTAISLATAFCMSVIGFFASWLVR